MKERRFLPWRWCPNPERMKATRTRPSDRSWLPLAASTLVLSLLAIQAIQPWAPSAVNVAYPNNYGALPAVEAPDQAAAEAPQASQITSAASTEHITVQFIFPDSADPGQAITVTATSTAKSSAKVTSLTIEVYAYVDGQLIRAASETVLKNKQVRSGNSWQTTLSLIVPQSAQRSVMIGTVTEIWEVTSTYYASYAYWPDYPYYSSYPDLPYYWPYPYQYVYPSYTVTEKSSQQTVPLTYVLATTPEYESLMQQYQQLQQNYDTLVAEHNDLVSRYNSLTAEYDDTVSKYNQLQSEYNSATMQLSNYKTYTYILAVVAVAIGVAFIFLLLQRRQVIQPPTKHETATGTLKKTSKETD